MNSKLSTTDVFQLLPSVPSLCRDRVNMLLASLNGKCILLHTLSLWWRNLLYFYTENYTGVIQESVYHSILVNAWEVSKSAGDMSMFLKTQLASHNNLGLYCTAMLVLTPHTYKHNTHTLRPWNQKALIVRTVLQMVPFVSVVHYEIRTYLIIRVEMNSPNILFVIFKIFIKESWLRKLSLKLWSIDKYIHLKYFILTFKVLVVIKWFGPFQASGYTENSSLIWKIFRLLQYDICFIPTNNGTLLQWTLWSNAHWKRKIVSC